jgi:hypothetical protein
MKDEALLKDVKETLSAIEALKTGKVEEKKEEVVEAPAVEAVVPADEKKDDVVEEANVEVVEDKKELEVEPAAAADEAKVEEPAPVVEEKNEEVDFVKSADLNETLSAIKALAEQMKSIVEDVAALKAAKSTKKSVMPAEEAAEDAVEDTDDEQSKLKKQAAYIFKTK